MDSFSRRQFELAFDSCLHLSQLELKLQADPLPAMQLYLARNEFLNQRAELLIRGTDADSFLHQVKLTSLQLEIIEPDTVAVDWVVWHVWQDDAFRTRDRKYKHVLSHAYLFIEGVLNQRLDTRLLFG